MHDEISQIKGWINSAVGALLTIMLGANAFFVKKAFDKIESLEGITYQLRQDVAVMSAISDTFRRKYHKEE